MDLNSIETNWLVCPICKSGIPEIRIYQISNIPIIDLYCQCQDINSNTITLSLNEYIFFLQNVHKSIIKDPQYKLFCMNGHKWMTEEEIIVHEQMYFEIPHQLSKIPIDLVLNCQSINDKGKYKEAIGYDLISKQLLCIDCIKNFSSEKKVILIKNIESIITSSEFKQLQKHDSKLQSVIQLFDNTDLKMFFKLIALNFMTLYNKSVNNYFLWRTMLNYIRVQRNSFSKLQKGFCSLNYKISQEITFKYNIKLILPIDKNLALFATEYFLFLLELKHSPKTFFSIKHSPCLQVKGICDLFQIANNKYTVALSPNGIYVINIFNVNDHIKSFYISKAEFYEINNEGSILQKEENINMKLCGAALKSDNCFLLCKENDTSLYACLITNNTDKILNDDYAKTYMTFTSKICFSKFPINLFSQCEQKILHIHFINKIQISQGENVEVVNEKMTFGFVIGTLYGDLEFIKLQENIDVNLSEFEIFKVIDIIPSIKNVNKISISEQSEQEIIVTAYNTELYQYVFLGTNNGVVFIVHYDWNSLQDANYKVEIVKFNEHKNFHRTNVSVNSILILKNRREVISCDDNEKILIWDYLDLMILKLITLPNQNFGIIREIALFPCDLGDNGLLTIHDLFENGNDEENVVKYTNSKILYWENMGDIKKNEIMNNRNNNKSFKK